MEISEQLKIIRKSKNMTQAEFAESLQVATATIASIENGSRDMPKNLMRSLVNKFGIDGNWLLIGKGEMFSPTSTAVAPAHTKIPLLRQTVSCGRGQSWEDVDAVEDYIEPLALIPSAKNAKIYAFRVRGTSMVGAGINDGDIILFDAKETDTLHDDLYVFALEGNVYCKLLKFDSIGRKISIYSVHTKELRDAELLKTLDADKPETADTFHIFGRVFAWIQENRLMWR
mgnify:CR=1 FL=1